MNPPPDPIDRRLEAEFSDVIDHLGLPDLRLRGPRRAVIVAAFEQARATPDRANAFFRWARPAALAAAIVILAFLCRAALVPKQNAATLKPAATSTDRGAQATAEDPVLPELNVTLAIVNARTAAAERELAWLEAMHDDARRVKEPTPARTDRNPFHQP
jgi:hypothetical protein